MSFELRLPESVKIPLVAISSIPKLVNAKTKDLYKMSAESAASFIKFSNSSELDLYRQNLKSKKKNRLIKFLMLVCVGMALTLLLHEVYHWQKGCGRDEGERVVETIKIITVEKQPKDIGVITLTDDEGNSDSESSDTSEEEGQACMPGSTKRMDCNTCRCNDEGNAYSCTKMACLQLQDETPSKVCTPGHVKMEDCNTCMCNDEGTGYGCTKMACGGLNVNLGKLGTVDLDDNEK